MNFFGKFPSVRLKQFRDNPRYILFWLKRILWYKRSSFQYLDKYVDYQPLTPVETLAYIIEHNMSIIRFGDGEFGLLSGAGIYPPDSDWSQRYSLRLAKELSRLMCISNPLILLSFPPGDLLHAHPQELEGNEIISSMHTETRMFLWKRLMKGKVYGDWGVFIIPYHRNFDWNRLNSYIINKTVVIVTGGTDSLTKLHLGKRTLFVECGKHDAFEQIDELKIKISKFISDEELKQKETLFMVSLGCSAGFIIEHLSDLGFVGWDTGHFFRFAQDSL